MPPVTALLSFILTVMRGYDTQSVIFGLATHTRAVVTGWWQASFRHLTADWAPFCGDISSSQLLGQQPARCRGSSSFDRLSSAENTVCAPKEPLPMWGAWRLRTKIALLSAPEMRLATLAM